MIRSKFDNIQVSDDEVEPEPTAEDLGGMSKFDHLMKAAVSIKSAQLEQKRKKFELLPTFLKAGVYYTQRLGVVRKLDFYPKLFAFQLLKNQAEEEYLKENYDRSSRKFEEVFLNFSVSRH